MRTFLITGGNSGIGFEAARQLAGHGHLILGVRDLGRGEAARARLLAEHPNATVTLEQVDLSDLSSVRALAGRIDTLDVLINNAGLGVAPLQRTKEGVYLQFAANHLGHFLLTQLLLPKLEQGDDPRVVTVSSGFGKKGRLDLANLDASKGYGQGKAYMQSKLANALFGAELDRRLKSSGSRVKSIVVHPGVAATEMQQKPTGLMGVIARAVSRYLARSAQNGAMPTVTAALEPQVQSGEVYGPGKKKSDPPLREPTWPSMKDVEQGQALWARSEALTSQG